MAEKQLVSVRLPKWLIADLKARAAEQGVTMTELIFQFSRLGLEGELQEQAEAQFSHEESQYGEDGSPSTHEANGGEMVEMECLGNWSDPSCRDESAGFGDWSKQFHQLHCRLKRLEQQSHRIEKLEQFLAKLGADVRRSEIQLEFAVNRGSLNP